MSRSAIVVGVGPYPGVGAALCRRLASEGLHVFMGARNQANLETVGSEITSVGGQATPVPMDTTVTADVERIFDVAEKESGIPELVIFNAGNNQFSPLLDMSDEFFENLWRVCALGGFKVGRESAKRMIPNGGGSVLFTGATASVRARPPFTAFAAAKAAERAVAHGMAREFGKDGLHVGHVIIDGVIDGDVVNGKFPGIKDRLGEDGMLQVDDIAGAFWELHQQPRSTWTLELDIRPHKEQF
jgi:NAD(P)-dependent dehydrogenase (short-subunit alcohol dehydrogenase family)